MTADFERIEVSTVVRDVGVLDRPDVREDERRASVSVLEEFVGVLEFRPWRADWPRPALSYLTLAPAIVQVLRESGSAPPPSSVSAAPGREVRDDDGAASDDVSVEEPRVRDLLERDDDPSDPVEWTDGPDADSVAGRSDVDGGADAPVTERGGHALGVDWETGRERTVRSPREGPVGTPRTPDVRAPGGANGEPRDEDGPRRRMAARSVRDGPPDRIVRLTGGDPGELTGGDPDEPTPAVEGPRERRGTEAPHSSRASGVADVPGPESVDADRPPMVPLRGAVTPTLGGARASGSLTDAPGGPGAPERARASGRPGGRHGDPGDDEPPRGATPSGDRPNATRTRLRKSRAESGAPRRDASEPRDGPIEPRDTGSEPRPIDELVDVERLADRLDRVFERRSRIERERRGR